MKEYNHEKYIARNKKKSVGKFRLPTIQELLSLVDYTKHDPASNEDITSDYYWSSTADAYRTDGAWYLYFNGGGQYDFYKTYYFYVRCVRDTQDGLEWSKDAPKEMTWDEAMEYVESLNVL